MSCMASNFKGNRNKLKSIKQSPNISSEAFDNKEKKNQSYVTRIKKLMALKLYLYIDINIYRFTKFRKKYDFYIIFIYPLTTVPNNEARYS